jgi:hypothetical protein
MEAGLFLWHLASIFCCCLPVGSCPVCSFQQRESAVGRSLSGRSAIVDSGRRDGALHHGSVLESAELAAFAGIFMVARTLEKRYVRAFVVAGVRGLHAPADVGFSIFVLLVVRGHGQLEGIGRA